MWDSMKPVWDSGELEWGSREPGWRSWIVGSLCGTALGGEVGSLCGTVGAWMEKLNSGKPVWDSPGWRSWKPVWDSGEPAWDSKKPG